MMRATGIKYTVFALFVLSAGAAISKPKSTAKSKLSPTPYQMLKPEHREWISSLYTKGFAGDLSTERRLLMEASKNNPKDMNLKWFLLKLYFQSGKNVGADQRAAFLDELNPIVDQLVEEFRKAKREDLILVSEANRAVAHYAYDVAIEKMQKAIDLYPNNIEHSRNQGTFWIQSGNWYQDPDRSLKGIEILKSVAAKLESDAKLETFNKAEHLYYEIGYAYYGLGEKYYPDAIQFLEKYVTARSGQLEDLRLYYSLYNMGAIRIHQNQCEEAKVLAERAIASTRGNSSSARSLQKNAEVCLTLDLSNSSVARSPASEEKSPEPKAQ